MELEILKYKLMSKQIQSEIQLSKRQDEAFNIMTKGENIFLTGVAGSGKTSCIKLFMKIFNSEKKMGITSTTGISALLFGGVTLHSFLGIGLGTDTKETMISKIYKRPHLRKRWRDIEVLIIDEISMLSPELFDKLEFVARKIRFNESPFGGIQLILSGDFLQLPCINSDKFCFEADSWNDCIKNTIYLDEIMRQKSGDFQDCLNNIRLGITDKKTRKILNSRMGVELKNNFGIKPTRLHSTNYSVNEVNTQELYKLAETGVEFFEYNLEIQFYQGIKDKEIIIEKYKKNCNAESCLQLCIGAQVMLLYNMDILEGLVNGSRGVVVDFIKDIPLVKFLNGREVLIDYHIWELEEYEKKILKCIQIPLKLAYAITQHKSQGMTLDYVELDLANVFDFGMAYVALSRVKTIEGLSIINIDFDKITANPKAVKYYEDLNTCLN
jgi:ATP-dependent DNA helicase PIF1